MGDRLGREKQAKKREATVQEAGCCLLPSAYRGLFLKILR